MFKLDRQQTLIPSTPAVLLPTGNGVGEDEESSPADLRPPKPNQPILQSRQATARLSAVRRDFAEGGDVFGLIPNTSPRELVELPARPRGRGAICLLSGSRVPVLVLRQIVLSVPLELTISSIR